MSTILDLSFNYNVMVTFYIITVDPPNTAALGTGEKTAVLKNGGKGSHI